MTEILKKQEFWIGTAVGVAGTLLLSIIGKVLLPFVIGGALLVGAAVLVKRFLDKQK